MLVNHVHLNIKHIFSTITDSCICQKVVSIDLTTSNNLPFRTYGFVTHNDILKIYRTITIKKYF